MIIRTEEQLSALKKGGAMLAEIRDTLAHEAKAGMTTRDLEKLTEELLLKFHVASSFRGHMGYPSVVCLSVNDQAVHTVPSDYVLKIGDLLKIDMGIIYKGFHTDTATTVLVGDDGRKDFTDRRRLVAITRDALSAGIAQAQIGNRISDIGRAVENVAQKHGFSVLKELGGHGIGTQLHEEPFIPNFYDPDYNEEIVEGMVLALEPILSSGSWEIKDGKDGFTYRTKDGSLSAHFEHTLVAATNGPLVVTEGQ